MTDATNEPGGFPVPVSSEPAAWRRPFLQFADYLENLDTLVGLVHQGVRSIGFMPAVRGALRGPDSEPDDKEKEGLRRAALAQSEIDRDFPLFHAYSLIGLWGALEAAIEDACAGWLLEHPECLGRPELAKIKIPLSEFLTLAEDERMTWLISEVQRNLRLDFSIGAGQFEGLLAVLGLGGAIDPAIRKCLLEAQQIRNVWAHRAGVADRRFVERLPDRGIVVGQEIRISSAEFAKLTAAIQLYLLVVINRFRVATGEASYPLPEDTLLFLQGQAACDHQRVPGAMAVNEDSTTAVAGSSES